jgi:hypothetical protein
VPEGYEVLSRVVSPSRPQGTQGPYSLTLNLLQPVTDGRNIGFYTQRGGRWERVASATLVNNGAAARGDVAEIPSNLVVLRRVTSAVQVHGWLAPGEQVDSEAMALLTMFNPVDYTPGADGSVSGTPTAAPPGINAEVLPTVRTSTPATVEAVNTILSSPQLREAHVAALVQLSLSPGNAGVDLDYRQVAPVRKPDFTAFVTDLAARLHQSNRVLSLTLPMPTRSGPATWDTGAYDWENLAKQADWIKLVPEADPSLYYDSTQAALEFLRPRLDLKRVLLVIGRASKEKATDGLRTLTLIEALTLASAVEVRNTVAPNAQVNIVGKNIFQDDGATGIRWDDKAFAVAFTYPGRGGARTVWFENAISIAFRIDLARRYGLGGVAIDGVGRNPDAAAIWEPVRAYAETGSVTLAQPNGVLLRPEWKAQAGDLTPGQRGNVIWRAPSQAGLYDVSLTVSDGVVRASQKLVLDVRAGSPAAAPTATPTRTP